MFSIRIFASFLIAGALGLSIISCSGKLPTDPASSSASEAGNVSLSVSFPKTTSGAPNLAGAPLTDFSSGTAVFTSGASTVTVNLVIANGKATGSASGLKAGVWNVTISFYNAQGGLTFSGSTSVTVKNGVITPLNVTVNPAGGSLDINIDLPVDPADFIATYNSSANSETATIFQNGPDLNATFYTSSGSVIDTVLFQIVNISQVELVYNASYTLHGTVSADGLTISWENGVTWVKQ